MKSISIAIALLLFLCATYKIINKVQNYFAKKKEKAYREEIIKKARDMVHYTKEEMMRDVIAIRTEYAANESSFKQNVINNEQYLKNLKEIERNIETLEEKYGLR